MKGGLKISSVMNSYLWLSPSTGGKEKDERKRELGAGTAIDRRALD